MFHHKGWWMGTPWVLYGMWMIGYWSAVGWSLSWFDRMPDSSSLTDSFDNFILGLLALVGFGLQGCVALALTLIPAIVIPRWLSKGLHALRTG